MPNNMISEFEQILLNTLEERKYLSLEEAEAILGNMLSRDKFLHENLNRYGVMFDDDDLELPV